jgi:Arc/MetJ-type ribon-helix-helix transcriptional regulator
MKSKPPSLKITLPVDLVEYVERQVAARGYRSISDYLTELIRKDRRRSSQLTLERELLSGLTSRRRTRMSAAEWKSICKEVKQRLRSGKTRRPQVGPDAAGRN